MAGWFISDHDCYREFRWNRAEIPRDFVWLCECGHIIRRSGGGGISIDPKEIRLDLVALMREE